MQESLDLLAGMAAGLVWSAQACGGGPKQEAQSIGKSAGLGNGGRGRFDATSRWVWPDSEPRKPSSGRI